ncbi:MAG: GNAT family N-acetyltransferase [Verrucomicrobiales bacterium]|nr:GNAT family N-acetyltransferase [Verrucomicrobiales bacterium]
MKTIRLIEHNGPEFGEWLGLREEVLRKPLGLTYSDSDIAAEADHFHLCLFFGGSIAAGLILQPLNGVTWKMRQVAVSPREQKKGLGRELVAFSEEFARENGAQKMTLHARQTAVPFYLGLDYRIEGDAFMEVGLTHFAMGKKLVP